MANPLSKVKIDASQFETPLTIRHVETHLVFAPLAKHLSFGYVLLLAGIIGLVAGCLATQKPMLQYFGSILDKLVFLIIPFVFLQMSKRHQAIIGWLSVKVAFGLAAFIMATAGAGVSFRDGKSDAWVFLALGLIWFPGLEFIPKLTPHQRFITLARLVLTTPCVYFGMKSGNWHW